MNYAYTVCGIELYCCYFSQRNPCLEESLESSFARREENASLLKKNFSSLLFPPSPLEIESVFVGDLAKETNSLPQLRQQFRHWTDCALYEELTWIACRSLHRQNFHFVVRCPDEGKFALPSLSRLLLPM